VCKLIFVHALSKENQSIFKLIVAILTDFDRHIRVKRFELVLRFDLREYARDRVWYIWTRPQQLPNLIIIQNINLVIKLHEILHRKFEI
jgi:hypothetical protein